MTVVVAQALAVGGALVALGVAAMGWWAWRMTRPLLELIADQQATIRELRQELSVAQAPLRESAEALELSNAIMRRIVVAMEESDVG